MLRVISSADVRALYSINDTLPAMRQALIDFSNGSAYQHPRVTVEPPGEGGMVLLMPAASGGQLGLKLLSMFPRAGERGLASVQGLVVLLDAVYGEPLAILDATTVTEIRTAAVTAVATDALARPDASGLAVIGAGVQAKGHIQALAPVRPWKFIRLYSRSAERAQALAAWSGDQGVEVEITESASAAVRDADVICTATSACEPVLADEDVAKPGVHISAVGAFGPSCRELPTDLIGRARLFVDSRQAALSEAGDLVVPLRNGTITENSIVAEIGEVLAGAAGRLDNELTVFKSLGLPIQDAVACAAIYQRAVRQDVGTSVEFP